MEEKVADKDTVARVTLKERLFGNYDYAWLCTPVWPFGKNRNGRPPPPFFPVYSKPGIVVAILMGLQHSLAMVGGLIVPPLLIYRTTYPEGQSDPDLEQYMISASLIVSGMCSLIQIFRIGIPAPGFFHTSKIYIGTGLLSLMGTSFTFLPIFQSSIGTLVEDRGEAWRTAYGKLLGTAALCSLLEVGLSLFPPSLLRRLFPPTVTGTAVFLIGASLIGSGIKSWGGGAFCADNYKGLPAAPLECQVTDPVTGGLIPGECFEAQIIPGCDNNGEVVLPFGSTEYLGLGFSVFAALILVELFGSPAMRNVQVIIGLLIGCIIAAASSVNGPDGESLRYFTDDKLKSAPSITFIWVETFPLGVYGPAILPMLIAYVVTTVESVGDVTATIEASLLDVQDESEKGAHTHARIQGGLLGDALSSLFAVLATSPPNTTFSQNNGVISLTRCASRHAGFAAAGWLLFMGIFSKVAAFFTSIPDCVLGGMTTFLFASVTISGIRILASTPGGIGRRERFILAISLGAGLGVTIVPQWTQTNLWPLTDDMSETLRGVREAVIITLSTGYSIGVLAAMFLNAILPLDGKEVILAELDQTHHGSATLTDGKAEDEKAPALVAPPVQSVTTEV